MSHLAEGMQPSENIDPHLYLQAKASAHREGAGGGWGSLCLPVLRYRQGAAHCSPKLPKYAACVCSGSESREYRLCHTRSWFSRGAGPQSAGGVGSAEDPLAPEPQGDALGTWQQKGSVHLQHRFSLKDQHGPGRCIK